MRKCAARTFELRALFKTSEVGSAWQDFNDLYREDVNSFKDLTRYSVPFWLLKKWYQTYKKTYMGYWDPGYLYKQSKRSRSGPIGYGQGPAGMGKSSAKGKVVNQHPTGALVGGAKVSGHKKRKNVSRFKKLENKVRKLNKNLPKFAKHTQYSLTPWLLSTGPTSQTPQNLVVCNYTVLNGIMNSLPYLAYTAPQTAANMNLVNPGATTTAHDMSFKMKVYCELELRNNNTFACDLWLYLVRPKAPTADTPITKFATANLIINQQTSPATSAAYTDPIWRPSHIPSWVRDWDIVETYKQHMVPGQEFKVFFNRTVTHSTKGYTDNGSLDNDPVNTYWWLAMPRGSIAHDGTSIGYSSVSLDGVMYRKISLRYENDFPTRTFEFSQGLSVLATPVQIVNDVN